ncbi:MAG: tetratricopeptide repeat protein [Deltaproteobacteria bacterium]|nr:tetratricopeptide repeat protein [Deltaproteobacteria bacterium]
MKTTNSMMRASSMALVLGLSLALPALCLAGDAAASAYQRSYEHEAAGRFHAAVKSLSAAPHALKDSYFYQLRLGWLHYRAGDYRPAIAAYRRAAAASPRAIEPWLGRMLPEMALRLWKDAESSARKVLRMDPKNFLANSRLAWCLYNLGRHGPAERVYQRVLTLYPANISMRAGLGWSQVKQGKKAAALKSFSEVLAVSPRHASALQGVKVAAH